MRPQEPVTRAFFPTKSSLTHGAATSDLDIRYLRAAGTAVILLLLAAWAVFNWFATVHRIFDLYIVIPTWDYWRVPQYLAQIQRLNPRFLWSQHNEHRLVLPDVVFALDVLFFHGCRVLPLLVSFLCYAGSSVILAYAIAQEASISREVKAAIILITAVAIGWKGCALVLADPFLLQWTLMELAVLISLLLLARTPGAVSRWPLAGAVIAGIVATYSSANGLTLWPVLLVAGLLLRLSKRQMATLALSGSMADGLYFVGYHFSDRTNFANLLSHPGYAIGFIAAYLSMPFGGMKSPQFGIYVGLINLSLILLFFAIAIRHKTVATRPGIVLFGSYFFTVLSAILIAAGRMNTTDLTFTGPKAIRYLGPVMINWGVFIALLLWTAALRRWRIFSAPLLAAMVMALLAISFLKLAWWLTTGERDFVSAQITELSIENGLHDPKLLRLIFPDPDFVEGNLPALKDANVSIFYKNPGKWLGRPVAQFARSVTSQTGGAVTRILPRISGVEVVGWARDRVMPGFSRVLLVNGSGKIVGLGRRLPEGLPTELLSSGMPAQLAWVAFVPAQYATGKFSVQIVGRGERELQPVRGTYEFPEADTR